MRKLEEGNSRREFIAGAGLLAIGISLRLKGIAEISETSKKEPIIDIHQHIHYHERMDEQMLAHQRAMGVTTTFLLPSGRPVNSPSTHEGISNGLQAEAGGNAECYLFAKEHRKEFLFGACAVPDSPDALYEIEKYLKLGAVIIGELQFAVECDSPERQKLYPLAQNHTVPVLLDWQYQTINSRCTCLYTMLEPYTNVNSIATE